MRAFFNHAAPIHHHNLIALLEPQDTQHLMQNAFVQNSQLLPRNFLIYYEVLHASILAQPTALDETHKLWYKYSNERNYKITFTTP